MSTERFALHPSVESSLIKTFTGWDEVLEFGRQFYNAELACDIGGFKAGEIVNMFVFDPVTSVIQIIDKDGKLQHEQKVKLTLD